MKVIISAELQKFFGSKTSYLKDTSITHF